MARPELGDGRRVQPDRKDAGNYQHLVRRRDEERVLLRISLTLKLYLSLKITCFVIVVHS